MSGEPLHPDFDTIDLGKVVPTSRDDSLAAGELPPTISREHAMRIARFCTIAASIDRRRRGEPFVPAIDTPWEHRTEMQRTTAAIAVARVVQALQVLGYLT